MDCGQPSSPLSKTRLRESGLWVRPFVFFLTDFLTCPLDRVCACVLPQPKSIHDPRDTEDKAGSSGCGRPRAIVGQGFLQSQGRKLGA